MKSDRKTAPELLDRERLDRVVPLGASILVAVSGGADSVALLTGLLSYASGRQLSLQVVHINHSLRSEADAEERFVRGLCQRHNLPCHVRRLENLAKPSNTSPEQYWRNLRYAEFQEILKETKCDFLALGHTANDLAETFLFHLARGTGADGLVFEFYKRHRDLPIIRPLWKTERTHIEDTLRDQNQVWISDPTNADTRFSRNLIRHEVIPSLCKINPEAVRAIVDASERLGVSLKGSENPLVLSEMTNDETLDLVRLRSLGNEKITSFVREFVNLCAGSIMDRKQTVQAVEMITRQKTGLVSLSGRKTLVLTQEHGWIYPGAEPTMLELARHHCSVNNQLLADLEQRSVEGKENEVRITILDGRQCQLKWIEPASLSFRNRQPGDRLGSKLLSKLMVDCKIPWYIRGYAILVINVDEEIVCIPSLSEPMNQWIARHHPSQVGMARRAVRIQYSFLP